MVGVDDVQAFERVGVDDQDLVVVFAQIVEPILGIAPANLFGHIAERTGVFAEGRADTNLIRSALVRENA